MIVPTILSRVSLAWLVIDARPLLSLNGGRRGGRRSATGLAGTSDSHAAAPEHPGGRGGRAGLGALDAKVAV